MAVNLFEKYDVPSPRYTSYPTVPFWEDRPTAEQWIDSLKQSLSSPNSAWALYVHIPFCESLCTFCGCNTTITRNHSQEKPYIDLLLKEWQLYLKQVELLRERPLRQLHLGGGTPTFLSAGHLKELVSGLLADLPLAKEGQFEGSIEVDPRRTTEDQLAALKELGFDRVSMGVQDFEPNVQRLVHRVQPFEVTQRLTEAARSQGYHSVNYDLIYGLPAQTLSSFQKTVEMTLKLAPDRIALYSFALVPWIKPAQRLFRDEDLPTVEIKRQLYEQARKSLLEAGYIEIGMDHFALPKDPLAKSQAENQLHRNFMGYTDQRTEVLLGLGVSAISESETCFHQNEKVLPVYQRRVGQGEIPSLRGHLLNLEDQLRRRQILDFMTRFQVKLLDAAQVADVQNYLAPLLADGLVELSGQVLKVTEAGRPFLRNACMALDARLRRQQPGSNMFSQTV